MCVCVREGGGGGVELRPPSPLILYVRAMSCSKAGS